jgi:endonuclease/exonuclease/phosphatase family metal-dependent hydrolase
VSLRLLSYNIRYGGAGRERLLAAVITACDADVVVLQEATRPDVVKRLAADCGMPQWGSRLGHSLAFLSRGGVTRSVWHKAWFAKRSYLELAAGELRIFGVHLAAIHSNLMEQRRTWEARTILSAITRTAIARTAIGRTTPGDHVVTGDFNSIAPGDRLDLALLPRRLRALAWATGGAIRWRTVQLMLDAGYLDGFRLLHPGEPGHTFPTWDPHVRLDYCFAPAGLASGRVAIESCEVMHGIAAVKEASDHFPLLSVVATP